MTPETLTCANNIAPERLSALRDDALAPAEAQRLRAHITTCAACQARLADYDTQATALRHQRELEPGERVISGVHQRLATQTALRRRPRPSRRLWAGLATLAPVVAIILLFVYVFSGLAGRGHPATDRTPTANVPTATSKPNAPSPTVGKGHLPGFTPIISANAAWGAITPVATFHTPTISGVTFSVDALSPDGTTLAGTEMSGGPGGDQNVYLVSYDATGQSVKQLGPHWHGYGGPWGGALAIDAQDILYQYNTQPGATGGLLNLRLLAYDRQTGASWQIAPGAHYSTAESAFLSNGRVAFETADGQVWIANLSARQASRILPNAGQPGDIRLYGFTWPYVIYTYTPSGNQSTPVATTLQVRNMQTNTTLILMPPLDQVFAQNAPGDQVMVNWGVMVGDNLYFTATALVNGVQSGNGSTDVNYEALFTVPTISEATSGGVSAAAHAAITLLARWQLPTVGGTGGQMANDRLILMYNGFTWDLQERKLVRLDGSPQANDLMAGSFLLTQTATPQSQSTVAPQTISAQGAIYDTSALPVR